ncbi:hypothetical protein CerSpe_202120 [Prunus speciosa]
MAASLPMLSLQRDLEGPAKGIVVNTFVELETHAIKSFLGGKSQSQTPPVYPVGSVIDLKGGQADDQSNLDKDQHDKIIKWLDEQPQSSVMFFCLFWKHGELWCNPSERNSFGTWAEWSEVLVVSALATCTPSPRQNLQGKQ